MNVLKYKGYAARIDFDPLDRLFVGHIAGIDDIVGFHSDCVEGLIAAFEEAVDDYLATCAAAGKPPEKPCSGNVFIRVDPATHARIATAARIAGKSINQFGSEALEQAADRLLPA